MQSRTIRDAILRAQPKNKTCLKPVSLQMWNFVIKQIKSIFLLSIKGSDESTQNTHGETRRHVFLPTSFSFLCRHFLRALEQNKVESKW